jgi:glycine cleavage system H protein
MKIPSDRMYLKSHEWVKFTSDTTALIGISDFAQAQLGDIVFINLPAAGDAVTAGEAFTDLESVKAVADAFSPVTGTVSKVNETLEDAPQAINEDAYEAWIAEIEGITEKSADLLDAEAYKALCEAEEA